MSGEYSSLLNQAFKTLQSRMERGLYLLEEAGHPLHDNEVHLEPEFLNEIMELNEEILNLDNQKDFNRLKEYNQLKIDHLFR